MQVYSISEYLNILQKANLVSDFDLKSTGEKRVRHISYDSNDVDYNTLFICKGIHFKEEYLISSQTKGTVCYISEKRYESSDLPYIIVSDIKRSMAIVADYFYNNIWKNINMIGITGTKGKSTVTYFLKYIIDDFAKDFNKEKCAVISSIETYDGTDKFESHLTTPEAVMLHKHIDNAVRHNMEYLVMEVSSQALKYDRTYGIVYDISCYLNLGQDHISPLEHKDFEDYKESKMKLFDSGKVAVINKDGEYAEEVIRRAEASNVNERIVTFACDREADLVGYDIVSGKKGITFRCKCEAFDEEFHIGLPGIFNVSNALAAISMAYIMNIPMNNIKNGLKKARVSGRMEVFTDPNETVTVFVDYAHNKMSFETLFKSVKKEYPNSKIFIVFGCPGKKALGRRKELGEIAGEYADMCFLTEEDAGEEDAHRISEEIAGYIEKTGGEYEIIDDRRMAIFEAVRRADENTVILVTGKGRETRQKRGIEYVDTPSDVDYVIEALRQRI